MNYYISDLHIGHANVIRFDGRPFQNVDEMLGVLLNNWNERVHADDTVYILGDFIWAKEKEWPNYVRQFAGNKVLIRGNHDPKEFSAETKRLFADIKDMKEIPDSGKRVILSHYPMPFHRADYSENCWMLYGHVHGTREYDYLKEIRREIKVRDNGGAHPKGNFINVGCMMPWMNYTPRTLEEIIKGDAEYSLTEQ